MKHLGLVSISVREIAKTARADGWPRLHGTRDLGANRRELSIDGEPICSGLKECRRRPKKLVAW